MHRAISFNSYYLFGDEPMMFDIPVEIDVCRFKNTNMGSVDFVEWKKEHPFMGAYDDGKSTPNSLHFDNPDAFKVYMTTTEPVTSPNREPIDMVLQWKHAYDLILTTDVEILDKCKNAVMFPYGSTWLNKNLENINHPDGLGSYDISLENLHDNKRFEISFLCTFHSRDLEGYNKRKDAFVKRLLIKNPTLFYSSTRYPVRMDIKSMEMYRQMNFQRDPMSWSADDAMFLLPKDDKAKLFSSQFHISIESTSVDNYFSEKLIDALITKTVPIYWGCPNIGDFFDIRGMIIVDSESDIIELCNQITPETYEQMKPYIDENYERAKEYARPLRDRVKEEIEKKIKESNVKQNS
jgi:hypothetical protein